MANLDQPKGAEPFGPVLRVMEYTAAAATYPGDFVKQESAGKVTPASASNACVGVALSYASGDGQKVLVANHPDQLFRVQSDDATDPDAQTDIGLNYNIVVGTASTLYKRSAMELDGNTGATDSTLPLRLIMIDKAVNNALGANALCVVQINNHQLKGGTGTEGV
jgi:hypothetical protein